MIHLYLQWRARRRAQVRQIRRWGLLWQSSSNLDGERAHIICDNCMPALFRTRQQARDYANERYGYIRNRADLRGEPHGWRMPIPVQMSVGIARKRGASA
jgi:hypothetical protein